MSLQTQIELRDNFSAILNGIVSSINLAVDSMYDMQAAMNADVNMSSVEAAKEQIDQATATGVIRNNTGKGTCCIVEHAEQYAGIRQ